MDDAKNGYIPTGGNAVVMLTQDAAKQKAAWEFIKFVTGPEAQKIVVEMTGYLPTNARALAGFPRPLLRENPNYKTPILRSTVPALGCLSRRQHGSHLARAQRDIIGQVMRGEKTPEQGLADIVKTTRDMMKGA